MSDPVADVQALLADYGDARRDEGRIRGNGRDASEEALGAYELSVSILAIVRGLVERIDRMERDARQARRAVSCMSTISIPEPKERNRLLTCVLQDGVLEILKPKKDPTP